MRLAAMALVLLTALSCNRRAPFHASIWLPETFPLSRAGYIEWGENLAAATGGELNPRIFTGTVLLPPAGHLTGIRDGIVQAGYHAGTYTPSELPEDNVLARLSFNYSDYFLAAFATTEMNLNDPELQARWRKSGIVYGGGYATPPYRLFCTSRVASLREIRGKRIRTPGGSHSDWVKSVGAVPVNVASSEMYSGLDKGQLDCAVNSTNDLRSRSLWDVAPHTTLTNLGVYWSGFLFGFNEEFWKGLSPEERRIVLDTLAEAVVSAGIAFVTLAEDVLEEAPDHGVHLHEPEEDLRKSIADFAPVARTNAIRLGMEEFGLEDPEGLVLRFESVLAKWSKLLEGVDRKDRSALVEILKREIYDKVDVERYGVE